MKKVLVLFTVACAAFLLPAEEVALNLPKESFLYTAVPKAATLTRTENGCIVTLTAAPGKSLGETNAQWYVPYNAGFEAGKRYRGELTIKADHDAEVYLAVFLGEPPWKVFTKRKYLLKAGETQTISVPCSTKEAIGKVRVPSLFFGKAPVGTVFTITDVKLIEEK